ncbi:MAG TPA: terminase family protein [Thermoanaerobaculia bacterium]|nr:terminase family protein [Thermoanaerobaculia bacterium]
MLAHDLVLALDPAEFAREVGFAPDAWQSAVLRSQAPRILLNCSRQAGKSTVTAALAVHTAVYEPNSLVLLLSPSLRQSQELFKKALGIYRALDFGVSAEVESALRLELDNGSRIVSLPGTQQTVRGFSGVRLLAIDEAARVAEDLYLSVRPMLAVSGGRLLALSTPFGTRGWWYEAWRSNEGWERYEVPARDCPRIPPEFLAEEQRAMGQWWFAQEYECQFMDAETQPFCREDVERAFAEEVEAWAL